MTTLPDLADFAVMPTHGDGIRSYLIEEAIRLGTSSDVNHAILYVGNGQAVEAQPGGARVIPWDHYGADAQWSTGHIVTADGEPLTPADRIAIANAGRSLVGRPYGYRDFPAITLAQKRLGSLIDVEHYADLPRWERAAIERLGDPAWLICSQLVDYAHFLAGRHMFADGRPPGLVSPGDLKRILTRQETHA